MIEAIGNLIWFMVSNIIMFMWWVLSWSYPILGMITILILIYLGLQKLPYERLPKRSRRVVRLKQEPSFYKNTYGHWVINKPDKENQKLVRDWLQRKKLTQHDL